MKKNNDDQSKKKNIKYWIIAQKKTYLSNFLVHQYDVVIAENLKLLF